MVSSAKLTLRATKTVESLQERIVGLYCGAQINKLATDAEHFVRAVVSLPVSDVGAPKRA